MAHYAAIEPTPTTGTDNLFKVVKVIGGKAETEVETLPEGYSDWEEYYKNILGYDVKRCSYNTFENEHKLGGTPLRGNYPGQGSIYDADNDVFYNPQPYLSWTLDSSTWTWKPPVDYPADYADVVYTWNELNQSWDKE